VLVVVSVALAPRRHPGQAMLRLRSCGRLTVNRAYSHRSATPRCRTMWTSRHRRSASSSARYVVEAVDRWHVHGPVCLIAPRCICSCSLLLSPALSCSLLLSPALSCSLLLSPALSCSLLLSPALSCCPQLLGSVAQSLCVCHTAAFMLLLAVSFSGERRTNRCPSWTWCGQRALPSTAAP
jgi:hypothetical protein